VLEEGAGELHHRDEVAHCKAGVQNDGLLHWRLYGHVRHLVLLGAALVSFYAFSLLNRACPSNHPATIDQHRGIDM
jgi:hypothetical protein